MTQRREMNNKTTWPKKADIKREWFVFDVSGQKLGRAASKIAKYLMGKNSPMYTAHGDMGNNVILINADKIAFSGDKDQYLTLQRYSGYPGGLKTLRVKELMKSKPEDVIKSAVKGMLPNTRTRETLISRLYIYSGETHPHEAQKPEKINF